MMLARLFGTLWEHSKPGEPGEFELELEGKVAMGVYWTIVSCHVDECSYED